MSISRRDGVFITFWGLFPQFWRGDLIGGWWRYLGWCDFSGPGMADENWSGGFCSRRRWRQRAWRRAAGVVADFSATVSQHWLTSAAAFHILFHMAQFIIQFRIIEKYTFISYLIFRPQRGACHICPPLIPLNPFDEDHTKIIQGSKS